ncbi:Na-translocating system protein MpsC family protein [Paenibacillus sp. MB22_1]
MILDITGLEVLSFFTDVSTQTGERVMLFKLASNLEKLVSNRSKEVIRWI